MHISLQTISLIVCLNISLGLRGENTKIESKRTVYHWTQDTLIKNLFMLAPGEKLIIDPGVDVEFLDINCGILLQNGTLSAIGTQSMPITFYTENSSGWMGIQLIAAVDASFEYCAFSDINPGVAGTGTNTTNNGAIYSTDSQSVSIKNCVLTNNKGGVKVVNATNLQIIDCTFINNKIEGKNVGLVYLQSSNSSLIKGNLFFFNKTNIDGIISLKYNNISSIIGNSFLNTSWFDFGNPANGYPVILSVGLSNYENQIVINGNSFEDNLGNNKDIREVVLIGENYNKPENSIVFMWNNDFFGSVPLPDPSVTKTAIFADGITLTVAHSDFKNYNKNVIKLQYCNIKIQTNNFYDNPTIEGTIKFDNYASYTGDDLTNIIEGNIFTNNMSTNGGAIWSSIANNKIHLNILFNYFYSNKVSTSSSKGGAIFTENNSNLEIFKNIFELNSVVGYGGAICIENSLANVTIDSNLFKQNHSGIYGGAISIEQSTAALISPVNIYGNDFIENSSNQSGGAVSINSIPSLNNDQFKVKQNYFSKNTASLEGGAMFFSNIGVEADSNDIFLNQATNGGGVYAKGIFQSQLSNNVLYKNTASDGAGAYFKSIPTNLATQLLIMDNVFQNNLFKSKGGGCYFENCYSINMKRNYVSFNTKDVGASNPAGNGMYVLNSNLELYNCNFFSNEYSSGSTTPGGAVSLHLTQSNTFKFINCDVVNQPAQGGLFIIDQVNPANISIHNCLFWGNGFKSITYPFMFAGDDVPPISTYYCYFDYFNPDAYNVISNYKLISPFPGFSSFNDQHLICGASICANHGDPDVTYNDINFPPSCQGDRNDIGITGGPFAMESLHLFTPFQYTAAQAFFKVEIVSNENRTIKIKEKNAFLNTVEPANKKYHQWVFGDGKMTEKEEYTGNLTFIYDYEDTIEQATVTLILDTEYGKRTFSQTIKFDQNVADELDNLKDTEIFSERFSNIDSQRIEKSIEVFPNPNDGVAFLKMNIPGDLKAMVSVFNTIGCCVYKSEISISSANETTIDLSGNKSGLYFMRIATNDFAVTKKIILK